MELAITLQKFLNTAIEELSKARTGNGEALDNMIWSFTHLEGSLDLALNEDGTEDLEIIRTNLEAYEQELREY